MVRGGFSPSVFASGIRQCCPIAMLPCAALLPCCPVLPYCVLCTVVVVKDGDGFVFLGWSRLFALCLPFPFPFFLSRGVACLRENS